MSEQRYRILVVEDDRVDQLALERFIARGKLPFEYIVAGSVAEARMLLGAERFDAVVSDFNIGDGDAFDVIAMAKSLPVVVVTGSGDEATAVKALKAGAADYLIKDHERNYLEVLPATVENAILRARVAEQVTKLTRAVEQSPAAVMITDSRGRIEYVNPRFSVVTGYEPGEVMGRNPRLLKSGLHPPEFYRELWETVASGRLWHGEMHNRKKDGELFWESVSISPITNQDSVVTHYVAVREDITAHKQADAALRAERDRAQRYLDIAGVVIVALDAEGTVTLLNRRGAELLGYREAELLGRNWFDHCVPAGERTTRKEAFRKLVAGEGAPVERTENSVLARDGAQPVIAWHDTVLRDEAGNVTGTLSSGEDVTEMRRAEEARERLIAELDAFAHTVAHDLKNPLSVVLGFAELLTEQGASMSRKDLDESLDAVSQGARKMDTIIEELLLLAGVRQTEVAVTAVEMGAVVKGALERLTYMTSEFRPDVKLPETWPAALGHAPWIEEVWANYLSNGMRYGGKPPKLQLGGETVNDKVRFWVRDNGPGISEEQKARLFAPFTQLGQARTGGQGLGLSIVRRIMEKLGGEAWVEGEPGKGSTFGFTLPRAT